MAKPILAANHFQDETAAFAFVEAALWPNGPVCPHCNETTRIKRLEGKATRPGLLKCNACRKQFTVRIGTIFESSHLALRLWLQVIHLMCASKKGISTRQIQRLLNCSMKTAWFLTHRIREMMAPVATGPMGGEGKIVEVDETYIGNKLGRKLKGKDHPGNIKHTVVALVERGGAVRSFHVKENMNKKVARDILFANVDKASDVVTDEAPFYPAPAANFAQHSTVNHSADEYVRGDIHTNTIEGVFSIFKRGMIGTYQQCGEQHLQRYLAEFDFRYSNREKLGINDVSRAEIALKQAKGKRLTYRTTRAGQ
jgi:transposase-like protein